MADTDPKDERHDHRDPADRMVHAEQAHTSRNNDTNADG